MKSGVIVAIAVVVLLVVVVGYFYMNQPTERDQYPGNSQNNSQNQTDDSEFIDALAYVINIDNFAFSPSTLEINVNDMVTWDNLDSATHSIKSDSGSELSSQTFAKGDSYTHVFKIPGTYNYHCGVHPSMKGTIIVR